MFHFRLLYISEVFQLSPQWSSTRSYNQILGLYLFKTQELKNSYGFSWGVICVRNSTLSCEHYLKAPQRFQTGPKDSELTAYLDPTLVLQHTSTSEPQYLLTTSANFSCRIGHNLGHIGWNNREYHRLQWRHIGFMTAEITDDYIVFFNWQCRTTVTKVLHQSSALLSLYQGNPLTTSWFYSQTTSRPKRRVLPWFDIIVPANWNMNR